MKVTTPFPLPTIIGRGADEIKPGGQKFTGLPLRVYTTSPCLTVFSVNAWGSTNPSRYPGPPAFSPLPDSRAFGYPPSYFGAATLKLRPRRYSARL